MCWVAPIGERRTPPRENSDGKNGAGVGKRRSSATVSFAGNCIVGEEESSTVRPEATSSKPPVRRKLRCNGERPVSWKAADRSVRNLRRAGYSQQRCRRRGETAGALRRPNRNVGVGEARDALRCRVRVTGVLVCRPGSSRHLRDSTIVRRDGVPRRGSGRRAVGMGYWVKRAVRFRGQGVHRLQERGKSTLLAAIPSWALRGEISRSSRSRPGRAGITPPGF